MSMEEEDSKLVPLDSSNNVNLSSPEKEVRTKKSADHGDKHSEDVNKAGRLGDSCKQESLVKTKEGDKDRVPPASEDSVVLLKNFLIRPRKQANVDDLLEQFPRLENMPFPQSPKIEGDLFPKLHGAAYQVV